MALSASRLGNAQVREARFPASTGRNERGVAQPTHRVEGAHQDLDTLTARRAPEATASVTSEAAVAEHAAANRAFGDRIADRVGVSW